MSDPTPKPVVSPDERFYWDGTGWQPLPGKNGSSRRPVLMGVGVAVVIAALAVVVGLVRGGDKGSPSTSPGSTGSAETLPKGNAGVGGVEVALAPAGSATPPTMKAAGDVVRARLAALGVRNFRVAVHGTSLVVAIADGEPQRDAALQILGARGQLLFRPVIQQLPASESATVTVTGPPTSRSIDLAGTTSPEDDDPARQVILPERDASGRVVARYLLGPAEVTGVALASATAKQDPTTRAWAIEFTLTSSGTRLWTDMAVKVGRGNQIAIDLDGHVMSAPRLDTTDFPGKGVITGSFTEQEARDLAVSLGSGALPIALDRQTVQTLQRLSTQPWSEMARPASARSFELTTRPAERFESAARALATRLNGAGLQRVEIDQLGSGGVRVTILDANATSHDQDVLRILSSPDTGFGVVQRSDIQIVDLLIL